ncbi:MAG: protoporphyrinogen oxidase [Jatrophihabitantaceae bacterium]
MTRIAVIGGGISGLAAAWTLAERVPSAEVLVLEGSPAVGGKLRIGSIAGVSVDVGAEAMLARRPEAVELAREAGLGPELIAPLTTSAQVRAGGALHPLPARTMLGIPGDLDAARASGALTGVALERIGSEPGADPLAPLEDDVAVGALVRARLGDEVTERLVEPLLGGVYAGRSDGLSLHATMPALFGRLAGGGSLVRAVQGVVDQGTHNAASGPVFTSITGGIGRLPQRLGSAGRFTVRTSTTVREIARTPSGFRLTLGPVPDPEYVEADAVIVATPATKAAMLLREIAPAAAVELRAVETASMAITTLAYRDVSLPPGSGVLIGAREGFAVKAVTICSQKWPLRTGGLLVLRASVGRAGEPQVLQREDAELVAIVRRDLRTLLGIRAEPVDSLVTRWGGGLPQYAVGHVERVARVRAAVAAVPGLAVCGATYDGVGIPACIASATAAADRVAGAPAARGE